MKYIKKLIKEYQSIDKVILVLFFASVIALPSNLAKTWQPASSYYQGIFIEYWAPKVFASQLLLSSVFLLSFIRDWSKRNDISSFLETTFLKAKNRLFSSPRSQILTLLVLFILGKSAFNPNPERFWTWFSLFLFGPVLLFIIARKKRILRYFPYAVLAATSIQAGIAMLQILLQKNLFPYTMLGETQFSSLLFLAKSTLRENVSILPYGTTPHPNILAGWLVVGILSLYLLRKKVDIRLFYSLAALHIIVLMLTESISAWLTLPITWLFFLWKNSTRRPSRRILILITILSALFWTSFPILLEMNWQSQNIPQSITRRSQPIRNLVENLPEGILYGSGLGQAFPTLNGSEDSRSLWKYPQPLHNSGIILVFELGICTILLLSIYFTFDVNNYSLFSTTLILILPIFYLDHYLTTQISGQYIATVLLIFFNINTNDK